MTQEMPWSGDSGSQRWLLVCILVLLILPLVVFWRVALGQQTWAVGDFASYQVPMNTVASEQWRQGHLPLWNPYMEGGMPFVAVQNPGAFYPISILLWLLLPPWSTLGYSILIQLALTGLGTFLFLHTLRLHLLSCLFGAIVFQFSGFGMSHLGHVMFLRALPWIGFSLYGYNSWIDSGRSRYLACISLSVACLYLCGYPQMVIYASLLITAYFLFARHLNRLPVLCAFGAFFLGVGISAIQVFPGIALWFSGEFLRPGKGLYSVFTSFSFHPAYFLTFLFPRARLGNYAEMVGYVGVAPLLLALLGIIKPDSGQNNPIRKFFILCAIISMILAFGRYVRPLARLMFHLPIYGDFEGIDRHLMETSFSLAVLAAFGMEGLFEGNWLKQIKKSHVIAVALFFAAIALLAVFSPFKAETVPLNWTPPSTVLLKPLLFIVLAVALIGAASFSGRKISRISIVSLILLTAIDLVDFGVPIYSNGLTSPEFYQAPPSSVNLIGRNDRRPGPFRIISFEAPGAMPNRELGKELLAANYNVTYHTESVIGHEGLQLRRFNEVFMGRIPPWGDVSPEAVEDSHFRAVLDLYGVRYLLARRAQSPLLSKFYEPMASSNTVSIFQNPQARSRLFAVDPASVWNPTISSERVDLTSYDGHRVTGEVNFQQPAVVVHGTTYVSGWEATVDGRPAPILLVAGALQGVEVPAGTHHITFSYEPKSFKQGATCSFASLILLGLLCLRVRTKRAFLDSPSSKYSS